MIDMVDIEVHTADTRMVINGARFAVSPVNLRNWMNNVLHPWYQDQIVELFAYNGRGFPGWAPLEESTIKMRRARGIISTDPNFATGEMLEYLLENYDIQTLGPIVSLIIPGEISDPRMKLKIETAQKGQQSVDTYGTDTSIPPRPVLVMDESDRKEIMKLLQLHIRDSLENSLSTLGVGQIA